MEDGVCVSRVLPALRVMGDQHRDAVEFVVRTLQRQPVVGRGLYQIVFDVRAFAAGQTHRYGHGARLTGLSHDEILRSVIKFVSIYIGRIVYIYILYSVVFRFGARNALFLQRFNSFFHRQQLFARNERSYFQRQQL